MRILTRYFGSVLKRNSCDDIYAEFSNIIERGAMEFIDSRRLFQAFDTVYHVYCEKDMTLSGRVEINDLLARMKLRVVEYLAHVEDASHKVMDSRLRAMNWLAGNMMTLTGDPESQYEMLLGGMNSVGVMNAYIFVWEKPIRFRKGEKWVKPEYILMKAFRNQSGITHVPHSMQRILTADILNNRFMAGGRTNQWMLMGLSHMDMHIGIILADVDTDYFDSYEFISHQINITVQNITIQKELKNEKLKLNICRERQLAENSVAINKALSAWPDREAFCKTAGEMIKAQAESGRIILLACLDAGSIADNTDKNGDADSAELISKCMGAVIKTAGKDAVFGYAWHGRFIALSTTDDAGGRSRTEAELFHETKGIRPEIMVSVSEFRYHEDIRIEDMLDETADTIDFEKGRKENTLL